MPDDVTAAGAGDGDGDGEVTAAPTGSNPDTPPVAVPGPPAPSRRRGVRSVLAKLEWVLLIGGALVIALLIKTFLFQAFYIPSGSMLPTLEENDRVLVNKLSYRLHDVGRADIVVFDAPADQQADVDHLVKRVIGLPGETIEGREGKILIDGEVLTEDYLPDGTESKTFGPYTVPAGAYFVLGDNRQASQDSTVFGPIPEDAIVGRVFVRIWPLDRIGFL